MVEGLALIDGIDSKGKAVYVGETKIDWNSQRPKEEPPALECRVCGEVFNLSGQKAKTRRSGSVDIEISHSHSMIGSTENVRILHKKDEPYAYSYGLPIHTVVPAEPGSRWRITVEELPDSKPRPNEKNPFLRGKPKKAGG